MSEDDDPDPGMPSAGTTLRDKLLANLKELDKSLRRCYVVQILACLVVSYYCYTAVDQSRQLLNLKTLEVDAACVRNQIAVVGPFIQELTGSNQSTYASYVSGLAAPSYYRDDVERAVRLAREIAGRATQDLRAEELIVLVRSLRDPTADEALRDRQLGTERPFKRILPRNLGFTRAVCQDGAARTLAGASAPPLRLPEDEIQRRISAIAAIGRHPHAPPAFTKETLETLQIKLKTESEERTKGGKISIPQLGQDIDIGIALRIAPLALLVLQILIVAFHRHRQALIEALVATFAGRNAEDDRLKDSLHLLFFPWVLNFSYLEAERYRQHPVKDAAVSRGLLSIFEFLPAVAIGQTIATVVTLGALSDVENLASVDTFFIGAALVALVLTFRQTRYARQLNDGVRRTLAWTTTAPAAAALGPTGRQLPLWMLAVVAFVTNWVLGLSRTTRIDFSLVVLIAIIAMAARAGRAKAMWLGGGVVGVWIAARALGGTVSVWDLMYRVFASGPLYVPYSSLDQLVRLVLLGYLAGWLFDQAGRLLNRAPAAVQAAWRASGGAGTAVARARSFAGVVVGAGVIVLADVVVRVPAIVAGERRPIVLPVSLLSMVLCAVVGARLGARRGGWAGILAGVSAVVISLSLGTGARTFDLELHDLGHVVSFALIGAWSGRVARFMRLAGGVEALGLGAPAPLRRSLVVVLTLILGAALIATSIRLSVRAPGAYTVELLFLPLVAATVMLLGRVAGGRTGAWVTGLILGGMTLASSATLLWGWGNFSLGDAAVSIRPAGWTAASVVALAVAAYVSGRVNLVAGRGNQWLIAIGIFVAFEVVSILRMGVFLTPYFRVELGRLRLDVLFSAARLLEPWLTVVAVDLVLRRLAPRSSSS